MDSWPKTPFQAIDFIFDAIVKNDSEQKDLSRDEVSDLFYDMLYERLEEKWDILTDVDLDILWKNIEDEQFTENYLSQRIPWYYDIIVSIVGDILSDYIMHNDLSEE